MSALLGLTVKKEEDFSQWYSQIVTKSEMIDYYDVSGCYVLRPWAYEIWENIKDSLDSKIKEHGVKNAYFPIFVTDKALEKEKSHIEGFSAEVAWITHKKPNKNREEKDEEDENKEDENKEDELVIAIRPTSETIMYPYFSKWIKSHRDLPLKLNQWCNIVRWEFNCPMPFIRSREFLWQEGHTAHATSEEAQKMVTDALEMYSYIYEDILAVPVIKGTKTQKEKFAGGDYTTTVEVIIPHNGKGIQAATSHFLGQNFSREEMFDIYVESLDQKKRSYVWQTSWGFTTRSIGIMTMIHGDNIGLVLPPKIAPIQVVIIPCGYNTKKAKDIFEKLENTCHQLDIGLKANGIRSHIDMRDNYTPGWKFSHWELKGIPIRIEIGPRDMKNNQVTIYKRFTREKFTSDISNISDKINVLLDQIQSDMLLITKDKYSDLIQTVREWSKFVLVLNDNKVILSPWCQKTECEDKIKINSSSNGQMGAKALCIPFDSPNIQNEKCIVCGENAKEFCLFGRSY